MEWKEKPNQPSPFSSKAASTFFCDAILPNDASASAFKDTQALWYSFKRQIIHVSIFQVFSYS